ncbi:MAG: hypothetical protein PHU62_03565 [Bacteroidales bacterium]|jgi:hypothetical protein|nr:hypothetical protein [Bacteroidales bacterium]MDD2204235.1 hypothetical protein [Bacteroidales bacterium]MDD3152871.1 hypothetical protein [Bacteroidales bacterium]MDD3913592.1 hypothetical protein [Bacteroidales bacterium]MDD4633640.1 hypothetical protein [Bacteroidales bacterium]
MKTKTFALLVLFISASLFSACSQDEEIVPQNNITLNTSSPVILNYEQTLQISASSPLSINYSSKNEFHAKVSSSGLITAQHVGETNINLNNGVKSKSLRVKVQPKYNIYPTPCIEWGKTKNEIIALYGTPDKITATTLTYYNYSTAAPIGIFLFDDNGRLQCSSIAVITSYLSVLTNFLLERYVVTGTGYGDYIAFFVDELTESQITTMIALRLFNVDYLIVMYADVSNMSAKNTSDDNSLIEHYNKLLDAAL